MNEYLWHLMRGKGSGEYSICELTQTASTSVAISWVSDFLVCHIFRAAHILAPGAHARLPLVDRIDKLVIPVTFICESPLQQLSTPCD